MALPVTKPATASRAVRIRPRAGAPVRRDGRPVLSGNAVPGGGSGVLTGAVAVATSMAALGLVAGGPAREGARAAYPNLRKDIFPVIRWRASVVVPEAKANRVATWAASPGAPETVGEAPAAPVAGGVGPFLRPDTVPSGMGAQLPLIANAAATARGRAVPAAPVRRRPVAIGGA